MVCTISVCHILSKLVRCVKGAVLDVAVYIRKGSPTFGQHVSCLLTERDEEGMKIAEQFAKESVIINQSSVIIHQQSATSNQIINFQALLGFVQLSMHVSPDFK